MKTAMQELLEWHRKSMRSYSETNKMIESFFQKEKEQIESTFDLARDEVTSIYIIDGEDYYNKYYKKNK